MFTLVGMMLMRLLTLITSSPCSRLDSYCVQSSSTQHPSSSPFAMVSRPTRSPSHTSHAFESALTRPPRSPLPRHLATLGHFQKTATSFAIRNYSMSQIIRTSDWTSSAPITTTAWLATPASQDDQEHPSSILLAQDGRLRHRLHPLVFGLPSQQVSAPQALQPPSLSSNRSAPVG